ncbi:MAG: GNAT family N-acetyltransferase [Candidatus Marinimicrobia bacterium]|nr:GNAT family N-acetyltransferase [Candidatus Neomarinimicrobiota bacterium]MBT3683628.1 GNAT family N-acetyltransferase [Candidatus Neomarinimicrobiota bacterium]MBT3760407.1 GNAT family N-acetyltransferase [Candidatus Neomarinimicrobiota bacterium]MBT3896515.1 GNAT family N-acetyltransferase [Candidatus Neomarinimicrobiota bacterium]MBT4173571.1 GNAT family N-acetyltransferase [Candidatus Neomarinimicrobiota bacterium]
MKENDKIIPLDRGNKNQRSEFHKYISVVFPGISFQEWYSKGFWTEKYLPFSIYESGKIISNVSVSFMNIILNDKKVNAIQLGAVGTLPEYRHQGLSRQIMNFVIEKYVNDVDFFFLYSNESTIEFYIKFGFWEMKENIFLAESNIIKPKYTARKLDIRLESDYLLLQNILNDRLTLTRIFGAEKYGFITMWHILNLYQDKLYYLEKEKIIVIKEENNNSLCILDIIFSGSIDMQSLLPKIIESDSIQYIKYSFPPDIVKFSYDTILQEDTGLFILGDMDMGNKPFRFPEMAIT